MLVRILSGFLALVLLFFAYLQIDDPDPLIWTPIYLLGALWPAIAVLSPNQYALNRFIRYGAWLSVIAFVAGFIPLAPTIGLNWIHVEEAREALGYLLCAIATLVAIWTGRRNRPTVT